jgi:hypothetical protein
MRVYHFLSAQYTLKTLYEHRIKISTFSDLNDPFELWPFRLDSADAQKRFAKIREQFSERIGLVCFSRNWDNLLLWSHYGDKHKGICLGFDIPDDLLITVRYVSERLCPPQCEEGIESAAAEYYCIKFKQWGYEDEVRFCANLDKSEGGLYFYDFRENDQHIQLREVILGHRCSLEERAIERALSNYPHLLNSSKFVFLCRPSKLRMYRELGLTEKRRFCV